MKFTPTALYTMPIEKLVELFELTEAMNDENIPTVRGWLMDAIQLHNPIGFDAWLESENSADNELRRYVLQEVPQH